MRRYVRAASFVDGPNTMSHTFKCTVLIIIAFFFTSIQSAPTDLDDTQLVLVHILLRHGARTTYNFYPNDPHRNLTFHPVGFGGLTNEGKYGEFQVGQWLRREYNDFLGDVYTDDLIKATSTDTVRTKMSAQLVLAGMWPPNPTQTWHPTLAWMPIPVYYKKKTEEDLLNPENCEYKTRTLRELPNRPKVREALIKPYQGLFDYISNNSGLQIRTLLDLLDFYFIVSTEDEMGLALPEWTKQIYPEPLIKTTAMVYRYWNHDEGVRKINSGYFLKKLIDDSFAKINGTLQPEQVKMFMYVGHESTLGCLLDLLNAVTFKTHVPPYGSAVILELRKNKDNQYFFQLRYSRDIKRKPKVLTIPECDSLCPVKKFHSLLKRKLPTKSFHEACSAPVSD